MRRPDAGRAIIGAVTTLLIIGCSSNGNPEAEGNTASVSQAILGSGGTGGSGGIGGTGGTTGVNAVPCAALAEAVVANSGGVILNSQSIVDSYASGIGAYGGSNVGSNAIVQAAASITNNGAVVHGTLVPNSTPGLAAVLVPSGAANLPLGSRAPGSLNINDAASSITLAPGNYVAANINVNFPGSIAISPAGQVRIWVTGNLNLGGNENVAGIADNLAFLVTSSGWVNVNSGGSLYGLIYAPSSQINVNSAIFGSVIGASVTLNSGAAVHYDTAEACPPPSKTV